jgi:hypothetical protein
LFWNHLKSRIIFLCGQYLGAFPAAPETGLCGGSASATPWPLRAPPIPCALRRTPRGERVQWSADYTDNELTTEAVPKPASSFKQSGIFSDRELLMCRQHVLASNPCLPFFSQFLKKRSFFTFFYGFLPSE